MYNRVSFVINPISGSSHSTRIIDQAMRKLSENGILTQALHSRHTGHAEELARTATMHTDLIFAVGGDGTVREVIAGSADSGVPVAVIPTGTENIFAKYYRFQASEASILACVHRGVQHRMDLTYMNGRPFCIVAGAGFDAEVVHRLNQRRCGHITHLDYTGPIIQTFMRHSFPRITVCADGATIFDGRGLVFVGNLPRYCLSLSILKRALDHDGLLDVCIYPCHTRSRLLLHALHTLTGRHDRKCGVIYRQVKHVVLQSESPVPLEIDGDCSGYLPAEFTIRKGAVSLVLPPPP